MMGRDYRLLIFDWDGTIMDSLSTIVGCAQAASEHADLAPLTDRAVRDCVGLRLDVMAQRLLPMAAPAEHQQWVEQYRRLWVETFHAMPTPLPGAIDTIAQLAVADNGADDRWWLAVATGKSRRGLDREFATTGLEPRFLASRTADDAPSKPHPQMVLDILDELGVAPGEAVMIGDTSYDMEMATAAGVGAIGVLSGSHDRQILEQHGAKAVLPSIAELPAWLSGRA